MKFNNSAISLTLVCSFYLFGQALGSTNIEGITTKSIGAPNSLDYTLYYEKDGQLISPFHDIPLFANEEKTLYNMVVEIPRWTNAKNEINKETPLNPIKQDVSNGAPRFVPNIFPFKGYIWNYGAFPQTWEDPNFISPFTNKKGDNDPIDVIELGQRVASVGEIKQVKILGIIGLLDQDETDWKVVVIDKNDPLFDKLQDIDDVETYMPGYLEATNTLFRVYKIPSGKKENDIAFDGEAKDKKFATEIVLETHQHWQLLVNGTTPRKTIQTLNLSAQDSPYKVDAGSSLVPEIPNEEPLEPAPIDSTNDIWYHVPSTEK